MSLSTLFLCFVESNSEICFLVFIWCRPVVRVWPPLCPTTTNSPSALLHLQHHQINPQQRLKRVGEKNIKLFNVLNSLISSSDNHHEKNQSLRRRNFLKFFSVTVSAHFWSPYFLKIRSKSLNWSKTHEND